MSKKEPKPANVETTPTPTAAAPAAPPAVKAKASTTKAWTGVLSFGIVTMPVALYAASREDRISFNQLHALCHNPIRQQKVCSACTDNGLPKVLEGSEIIKGYQYEKGHYCIVDDAEIEAVKPESARKMELVAFVPAAVNDAELAIAQQLIEALKADWNPAQYRDSYRENVSAVIAARMNNQPAPVVATAPKKPAAVVNIAEALKASLAAAKAGQKQATA